MTKEVDKFKAIADVVNHLDLQPSGHYYVYMEYSRYLRGVFKSWENVIEFVGENRDFFSFYGITVNLNRDKIFYSGKRMYL